jgi:hypothetical protein
MTLTRTRSNLIRTLTIGLVGSLSLFAVTAAPADAAKKKTTKRTSKKTTKAAPPIAAAAAPTTVVPTTLALPTTVAAAAAVASPVLTLAATNGLKPQTPIAAGTYDFTVGTHTARVIAPEGSSVDVVDPNSVLFNIGTRQLSFFTEILTVKDPLNLGANLDAFTQNLRPFHTDSPTYEAYLKSFPFIRFVSATDFQLGSLLLRRHEWGLSTPAPNKTGAFTSLVPKIGNRYIPLDAFLDPTKPLTEAEYIVWGPDAKPFIMYVSVPKGEDIDTFVRSSVTALS